MGALSLPNRSAGLVAMLQDEFPGYHPLLAIARIAHDDAAKNDLKLQFECHKTIAKYIEPELKSLEVKPPADEHRRVKVTLFEVVDAKYKVVPKEIDHGA